MVKILIGKNAGRRLHGPVKRSCGWKELVSSISFCVLWKRRVHFTQLDYMMIISEQAIVEGAPPITTSKELASIAVSNFYSNKEICSSATEYGINRSALI